MKTTFLTFIFFAIFIQLQAQSNPPTASEMGYETPTSYPEKAHRTKQNGRWGFYDSKYVYVPFIYDELSKEYSDFMKAKKDGKYGIINKKGETVIPFEYEKLSEVLDKETKKSKGFLLVTKNQLHGVIDKEGKEVFPIQYSKFQPIEEEVYEVGLNGKFGLIRLDGTEITPIIYEEPLFGLVNGFRKIQKDGKVGAINKKGELILPMEYTALRVESWRRFIFFSKDEKVGVMDLDLKVILPNEYSNIQSKGKNHIMVSKGEKHGLFNQNFEEIVPCQYSYLDKLSHRYFKVAQNPGTPYGLVDTLGNFILPFEYQRFKIATKDLIFAKKEFKYAAYNSKGEELLPPTYYSVSPQYGYTVATKELEGKSGLLDADAKEVTPFVYDKINIKKDRRRDKIIITAEREGQRGTLGEDGSENNDFGEKMPPKPNKSQQELEKVYTALQGEWLGVTEVGGQTFLQSILVYNKESAVRTIYHLKEGQECQIKQLMKPLIISHRRGEFSLYTKFMNYEIQSQCGNNLPEALQTVNRHIFHQVNFSILKSPFSDAIHFKGHQKVTHLNKTDFEALRKRLQIIQIENELVKNIESRPGGIKNPKISIDPTTSELTLSSYGNDYLVGKVEIKEAAYFFSTQYWEQDNHYSLAGVWKNVHYIDADGKQQFGDLDLCFKATKQQKYWFRPVVK